MNISTGLSEINFQTLSGGPSESQKVFTWPSYQQNKVQNIKPVKSRPTQQPVYIKPKPEERKELLQQLHSRGDESYNAKGRGISESKIIKPGSFFNALV
jgi:hypothetical protein